MLIIQKEIMARGGFMFVVPNLYSLYLALLYSRWVTSPAGRKWRLGLANICHQHRPA